MSYLAETQNSWLKFAFFRIEFSFWNGILFLLYAVSLSGKTRKPEKYGADNEIRS